MYFVNNVSLPVNTWAAWRFLGEQQSLLQYLSSSGRRLEETQPVHCTSDRDYPTKMLIRCNDHFACEQHSDVRQTSKSRHLADVTSVTCLCTRVEVAGPGYSDLNPFSLHVRKYWRLARSLCRCSCPWRHRHVTVSLPGGGHVISTMT